MDTSAQTPSVSNNTPSTPSPQQNTEPSHITQELYKKNAELAARNKTLSLLRKIDEIILSSVTDPNEIADKVGNVLVEDGDFRTVAIYLIDDDRRVLTMIGSAVTKTLRPTDGNTPQPVSFSKQYELSDTHNIVIQAIHEKIVKTTDNPYEVIQTTADSDSLGINSTLIFPLIVRENVMGVMIVSNQHMIHDLSEYEWDLLGRLVSMVGISLDNSVLYNEVQSTNQKLKVLDRLKDEFVSLASHELRTPMTAIKSYLWLFLEDNKTGLDEKQKMYVERAYSSTDRLINLVNDMLNVSRIESGRLIINKKPVDLVQLIKDTLNEVQPTAQEQKKQLFLEQPNTKMPLVEADADKIKQVITNLLGNAIKFTPDGGKITVKIYQNGEALVTAVSDTGQGISKEDMGKLFKKFGIVSTTSVLSHGAQSTGLGLYICKSIVELHGGQVWAESDGSGKGSTFYFTLKTVNTQAKAEKPKTEANLQARVAPQPVMVQPVENQANKS